ncbi:DNA-binding protein, partial [Dysosmobacter welbionis]
MVVEVLLAGDLPVLLHLRVALDDVEIDLGEEVFLLAQDVVGLGDEPLHQVAADGAGGVDGDDEFLDPPDLLVLQRLHQGHIAVQGQTVGVVDIVELVLIHLGDLAQAHIAAEEVRIVIRL